MINHANTELSDKLISYFKHINATETDPVTLSRTFGYLKGQQYTLDKIKSKYPDLELEVKRAEIEFSLSFRKAGERIKKEIQNLMGSDFDKFEHEMMDKLKSMLESQNITKDLALSFIEEVKMRAKGNIESPVLETLLTYQFIEFPSAEFSSGFVEKYTTKGHYKAKGVTINAKLPISWKQKEGDRPNIVHKFISKNGEGKDMIAFMVKDLGLPEGYKVTKEEADEFFNESEIKNFLPDGSEFISAKKITLDRHIGCQLIFKTTRERLDFSITLQTVQFITIYEGKMIFLQCMVSDDEEDINTKFNLHLPLFRQVANSLIIMDQY